MVCKEVSKSNSEWIFMEKVLVGKNLDYTILGFETSRKSDQKYVTQITLNSLKTITKSYICHSYGLECNINY